MTRYYCIPKPCYTLASPFGNMILFEDQWRIPINPNTYLLSNSLLCSKGLQYSFQTLQPIYLIFEMLSMILMVLMEIFA